MRILLFILFIGSLGAQPPKKFYTSFGGDGDDVAYSGKVTLDRQYVVAGSTSSYGSQLVDLMLAKVDTFGFPAWQRYIGGNGVDVGSSVLVLPDSGFIVAGYTNSFGAGGYDAYIVKTDKNGIKEWERTFGGTDWDFANDIVRVPSGDFIVVGTTSSFGGGKEDGFLLKYDAGGNLLLQKYFGGAENDGLKSVIVTNDNKLAMVGYSESQGEPNGDGWFLKTDLNGDTIFTRKIGGAWKDYAEDVVQNSYKEYYVCGAGTYSANAKTEAMIYCMDSLGMKVNEMHDTRSATEDESFKSAANSTQWNILIGYLRTASFNATKTQFDAYVLYRNLYAYRINDCGGSENEKAFSMESTPDGGFLCVGFTNSYSNSAADVFIVKYDSTIRCDASVVGVMESRKPGNRMFVVGKKVLVDLETAGMSELQVIDASGNVRKKERSNAEDYSVDLHELSGFFILRLSSIQGILVRKIILEED